jgi:hypothetical protein
VEVEALGTSVPPEPRWADDTAPAEQSLWRWAVEQLPDPVLVLPQVPMRIATRGAAEEAEADLVLIDPDHGITVVEVKGGEVGYDAPRALWQRKVGRNRKEIRDPAQQAQRARSILRTALRQNGIDPDTVALRWAVATPDCRLEAPGDPVLPRELLWDALAAERLADGYRATIKTETLGEQPLGPDKAHAIARLLRGRSVDGRAVLSTAVDDHEARVRIHTESHRNVLRRIWRNHNVLVRGAAGTGKTVLALEAATAYASQGDRVLLACWNVVLAGWLRHALQAELDALGLGIDVTDDPAGQVVVSHLVGLARRGLAADVVPEDGDDLHAWYHEVLPEALTPAVTGGEFDVVVLDEAQDLTDEWIFAVAGLERRDGRWYAFSDRQQDLFAASAELPEFLEVEHELTENFRNSAQIAAFAAQFGHVETDCLTGTGPPVEFVACDQDRLIARAAEVAKRRQRDDGLAPSDLALLYLFHNPFKGRTDEVAAAALRGEFVTTNSASFKGMERPAVVLGLDMDPKKTDRAEEVGRAIYAAATRARSHLTVVGDPEVARAYGFAALGGTLEAAVERGAEEGGEHD